jgi:hypothetical protein
MRGTTVNPGKAIFCDVPFIVIKATDSRTWKRAGCEVVEKIRGFLGNN